MPDCAHHALVPFFLIAGGSDTNTLAVVRCLGDSGIKSCIFSLKQHSFLRVDKDVEGFYPIGDFGGQTLHRLVSVGQEALSQFSTRPPLMAMEDTGLLFVATNFHALQEVFSVSGSVGNEGPLPALNKVAFFRRFGAMVIDDDWVLTKLPGERIDLDIVTSYPVVVKPSTKRLPEASEAFPSKIAVASDRSHLENLLQRLCDIPLVLQPFFHSDSGEEFSYISFRGREGRTTGCIQQQVIKFPKTGGTATLSEIVSIPELEQRSKELLNRLDYRGISELEYMRSRNGSFHLIEMNPRPLLQIGLAIAAGFPLPYLAYCDLLERSPCHVTGVGVAKYRWTRLEDDLASVLSGDGRSFRSWLDANWKERKRTVFAFYQEASLRQCMIWWFGLLRRVAPRLLRAFFLRIQRSGLKRE